LSGGSFARVKPLRLGIAGCGDIAGYTALLARLNRKIHLAACCDRDLETARRFASRHRIPQVFGEYPEMLANAELEAVYLAVPHDLHLPMSEAALLIGLDVLCEKPLARSLAEGQQMAALARASGRKLGVNYQYRYDTGCYGLAAAARRGELGELLYARCNIPWRREGGYLAKSGGWHSSLARSGGGTLLTQGSHFLDILLWAMDSPPAAASGETARRRFTESEVEDLALGTVELQSGALIQVCSAMIAAREGSATIELYGTQATALYRDGLPSRLRFQGRRIHPPRPPAAGLRVTGLHALACSLEGFRRWVQEGEAYLIPAEAALPVLAAVEAIYHSAESGLRQIISL
jgi:predicted dehydrogenase